MSLLGVIEGLLQRGAISTTVVDLGADVLGDACSDETVQRFDVVVATLTNADETALIS